MLAQRTAGTDVSEYYLDALFEAQVDIAALRLIVELQPYVEADKLAKTWLAKCRVEMTTLSHDRQGEYRQNLRDE